jgi:hypothetical protein
MIRHIQVRDVLLTSATGGKKSGKKFYKKNISFSHYGLTKQNRIQQILSALTEKTFIHSYLFLSNVEPRTLKTLYMLFP